MTTKKIVGIFSTETEAIKAIERLKRDGYADSDISVVAKDLAGLHDLKEHTHVDVDASETADGAIGGAMTGGAIGGIGALLVELGLIAIPGVGPFLAAGPIAAAIAGALVGGAVGGILGALVDLGLSEEEAKGYEDYINRGDILVMVDEYPDRDVYGNFYENNSVIKDHYDNYEHVHRDTIIDERNVEVPLINPNEPQVVGTEFADPVSPQPIGEGVVGPVLNPANPNNPL